MMMAALVCFFGKNNALQPFPVLWFVILVSFAFARSVGSVFFRSTAYNLFYFLQLIYK